MSGRLPAKLEVSGLIRRIETAGGFATIVRKGDPEGGSLLLIVNSRGCYFACLERILGIRGAYEWHSAGPPESSSSTDLQAFLAKRTRFDPDLWVLELDIPHPERFIAETTGSA
jgi:hypothetical protein